MYFECKEAVSSWVDHHPPVGTFVAILAILGIFVPLFRPWERIKRWEKAAWTSVMFVLLILELRTLQVDRREHDQDQALDRCRQLERFQAIATTLQQEIAASKANYQSTIGHVDRVLDTTQQVEDLTKENLNQLIGGKSFAWATVVQPAGSKIGIAVFNPSKYPLRDLSVTFIDLDLLDRINPSHERTIRSEQRTDFPYHFGELAADQDIMDLSPHVPFASPARYDVRFLALNGAWYEKLRARELPNGHVATALRVYKDEALTHLLFERIDSDFPLTLNGGVDWR